MQLFPFPLPTDFLEQVQNFPQDNNKCKIFPSLLSSLFLRTLEQHQIQQAQISLFLRTLEQHQIQQAQISS